SPDTKLTDPFTVGNRLVKFDPESNSYKEVFRAPQNMSLQTLGNGSIVGINQETGEKTPILDDPTAAASADLKQRQGEQGLRAGEADIMKTEMGLIPQPYISGGNLITPEGAVSNVEDWDPFTGKTTSHVSGHHRTIPSILQSYGLNQATPIPSAPPETYRPQADTPTAAPAPAAAPAAAATGADMSGLPPAGITGTQNDPLIRGDYIGPPDTGPKGGTDWLFSSSASPVANVANTPAPEAAPAEEPPPDDTPPPDDVGAGADRRSKTKSRTSDLQA